MAGSRRATREFRFSTSCHVSNSAAVFSSGWRDFEQMWLRSDLCVPCENLSPLFSETFTSLKAKKRKFHSLTYFLFTYFTKKNLSLSWSRPKVNFHSIPVSTSWHSGNTGYKCLHNYSGVTVTVACICVCRPSLWSPLRLLSVTVAHQIFSSHQSSSLLQ